jgi:cytochrome c553
MKSSGLVALLLGIMAAPLIAAPNLKPDLVQGKTKVEEVCVTCHTLDGNSTSPIYPIVAGQHVEYLQKQLHDFKAGTRINNIMQPWAAILTDQDIVNVSAYYASQTLKDKTASNQELAEAGEKIYRGGIIEKNIPACMGCHGPSGAGIPSQYPQLSSQHATYTEAQLQAFKKANRANDPASMMRDIADKLSDAEIKAVAEYISGLR